MRAVFGNGSTFGAWFQYSSSCTSPRRLKLCNSLHHRSPVDHTIIPGGIPFYAAGFGFDIHSRNSHALTHCPYPRMVAAFSILIVILLIEFEKPYRPVNDRRPAFDIQSSAPNPEQIPLVFPDDKL
jgi:hypothetical protein